MSIELIRKYNVAGPRYTSYPTVPFWKKNPISTKEWIASISENFNHFKKDEISIYIHLPFCESLCTFCGCHKRITKNHAVEEPYIDSLIKEWSLYLELLPFRPVIREIHLGGGTPTFFNADTLIRLLTDLFNTKKVNHEDVKLSFEAHPNFTTTEQLQKLYDFGFRRISFGIQDYDPVVQRSINRIQSLDQVVRVHKSAKQIGYDSISHDLVYGLPKQTPTSIALTLKNTLTLRPDRISLYSYAHVPWIKGTGQRGFDESDLPQDAEKRELYEMAKKGLIQEGYIEVGMDHFALPEDELAIVFKQKSLHRNFMGYTTQSTHLMLGLGMSAISDSWFGFAQNEKSVEAYQRSINSGELAIVKGHLLDSLELDIRTCILDLMCHFETEIPRKSKHQSFFRSCLKRLLPMVQDKLVHIDSDGSVKLTEDGIPFVRSCCMAFDRDLTETIIETNLFSKTI